MVRRRQKTSSNLIASIQQRLSSNQRELVGLGLLVLAVITLLSLFSITSGAISDGWASLLRQLFGWGAIPVALGVGWLGIVLLLGHLRDESEPLLHWDVIIGLELLFVAGLALLHLLVGGNNPLEEDRSTEVIYPFYLNKPFEKAKSVGKAVLTFSTHKENRFVVDPKQMLLNSNIKPDPDVQAIIDEMQPRLEDLELDTTRARLQNQDPPPHFIGQQECMMCHTEIYDFLQHTRHVGAYDSLVEVEQERSAASSEASAAVQ